jgi:hypothetical protein
VAGSTESRQSIQTRPRPSRGRFGRLFAIMLIVFLGGIAGYIFGQFSASDDIQSRDDTIRQLNAKSQSLGAEVAIQAATIVKLQADLNSMHNEMGEMAPTENTYNIDPNQSIIVAKGNLTIGLIGSPKGAAVNININGKAYLAAAGDVIKVAPDASTDCRVRVQSFDMFKAVVTATCAKESPR